MQKIKLISLVALMLGLIAPAFSADFYVFPIREIEGFNFTNKAASIRPLVDKRTIELLTSDTQKQIIADFTNGLLKAYPNSVVSAGQVRDAIKGKYQYQANGQCGDGFVAPINKSYAVVMGVSRASYYEVDRENNIEVLIPITLNIQLVKPEQGKIVYTTSSTVYSRFEAKKQEIAQPATKAMITKLLATNTTKQMNELLDSIKKNFDPKETPVKVVDKSEGFIIVDKGFEVGFKLGDELEARLSKDKEGNPSIFKVISVDSGYSILKLLAGAAPNNGDEYAFVFETPADDSRKPKLMPVYSSKPENAWASSMTDIFIKDIGFKAPFQLAPVDANFNDTMNSVSAQANCVPWDKYPNSKKIFDSKEDPPGFYLKMEMGQSPIFTQSGKGGVLTKDNFMTTLSTQVIDKSGGVVFSEIGKDTYILDHVGNQGISLSNAKEISMKNALTDLMKNFLQSVKLEPKEFVVSDATKNSFKVSGLEIPQGQAVVYEVLHPTGVKVQSKEVLMKLNLDQGAEGPKSSGGSTVFSYGVSAQDFPSVRNGDKLRVFTMPKGNLPTLSSCGTTYVGKDSLSADFIVPMINHVAYKSSLYNVNISEKEFFSDANSLLQNGFYKYRIPALPATEYCFKPGYLVNKTEGSCSGADNCNAKFLTAVKLLVEKNGATVKDSSMGEQTTIGGFAENQTSNIIGFKAMGSTSNMLNELLKRFNTK